MKAVPTNQTFTFSSLKIPATALSRSSESLVTSSPLRQDLPNIIHMMTKHIPIAINPERRPHASRDDLQQSGRSNMAQTPTVHGPHGVELECEVEWASESIHLSDECNHQSCLSCVLRLGFDSIGCANSYI